MTCILDVVQRHHAICVHIAQLITAHCKSCDDQTRGVATETTEYGHTKTRRLDRQTFALIEHLPTRITLVPHDSTSTVVGWS